MRLTTRKEKKVFYPNDPDSAYVIIQYLKKGVREQIEQLTNTVTAQEDSDGEFGTVVEFNLNKKRKMFYEKLLVGWDGFFDIKGRAMKLTVANVEKVADELGGFYEWLQEISEDFIKEVEEEKDEELGNSDSLENGSR